MSDHGLPKLADGAVLTHIGADNLRALRMPEPVELRRLTFIVGRNGIGKSTFARLFPLLRQSAESKTREPLLWWDRDQVDMGSFSEAIRSGEGGKAEEMVFSFRYSHGVIKFPRAAPSQNDLLVRSALCKGEEGSRVKWTRIGRGEDLCHFEFDQNGQVVGLKGRMLGEDFSMNKARTQEMFGEIFGERESLFGFSDSFTQPTGLLRLTESLFHGNTDPWSRSAVIRKLDWVAKEGVISELKSLEDSPGDVARIRLARFMLWGADELVYLGRIVRSLAMSSAYLGPFRAVPDRGYRPRSVAVEQLGSTGGNLPEFLESLTAVELEHLNEFISGALAFRVFIQSNGASLNILVELQGRKYNLVDVGFGYSQVLPVMVQLWASAREMSNDRKRRKLSTLVIEQPELHLHPHQQVLVARALAASAVVERGPMLIIETHSDHMIGEIGRMVSRDELPRERVQVLCVDTHPEGGAKVVQATFDEEGYLNNWPVGFLSP
jgi:hypothetical protein